jgi:hypothetical protein
LSIKKAALAKANKACYGLPMNYCTALHISPLSSAPEYNSVRTFVVFGD